MSWLFGIVLLAPLHRTTEPDWKLGTMTNATTTPNATTIADFLATYETLDAVFDEIYGLAVYARTSDLHPHHENCPPESDKWTCAMPHKVYANRSLALAQISAIENAVYAIRDNAQLLQKALSDLSLNAGVEYDDYGLYANDQRPE